MQTETLKRLVEMAGIGCTPGEIALSLNLTLTPELTLLIQQVRDRAFQRLPQPSQAQIRRQMWINRNRPPPRGCNPFY
jgi:hypothetical protein